MDQLIAARRAEYAIRAYRAGHKEYARVLWTLAMNRLAIHITR